MASMRISTSPDPDLVKTANEVEPAIVALAMAMAIERGLKAAVPARRPQASASSCVRQYPGCAALPALYFSYPRNW